jgi:hypothetical protein
MLSHACPSSVLANGEWHSRERLVQSVDVIRKIGRTPAVPAEIHVVPDYIGCGSERYAIDPAEGCERGEPTRIDVELGLRAG